MSIIRGTGISFATSVEPPVTTLDFSYTGSYNKRDDGVVELLDSGVLTFNNNPAIDVFMVGGGGNGGKGNSDVTYHGAGGGGGGYTQTIKNIQVVSGEQYTVTIGSGGGGKTYFNSFSVNGGNSATTVVSSTSKSNGGNGGSGGCANFYYGKLDLSSGGSDGSNGGCEKNVDNSTGSLTYSFAGIGQGYTTREFGDLNGKLYAGGGGAGSTMFGSAIPGGSGGGGMGGGYNGTGNDTGAAGDANTGGGAGGNRYKATNTPAVGGSGIVCIRIHKKDSGHPFDFEYTGNYYEREDNVIELHTSGTFTLPKSQKVDIFCVGGGGSGFGDGTNDSSSPSGGGGGGYTKLLSTTLPSGSYSCTIGAGGVNNNGGTTSFGELVSAAGGNMGTYNNSNVTGGNGGSGGGGDNGQGGSNGSNGQGTNVGKGQGTTTYEFNDETTGKLYSGGGSGLSRTTGTSIEGGSGGGGYGGYCSREYECRGGDGKPGTGGGGGGAGTSASYGSASVIRYSKPGRGGSGIICIRLQK